MGYVGSQLVKHLKLINKNFKLYGYDTAYFGNNCINSDNLPEVNLDTQFSIKMKPLTLSKKS